MTFRFFVATIVCLLLVVAKSVVLNSAFHFSGRALLLTAVSIEHSHAYP
jgi:hypothetical protein